MTHRMIARTSISTLALFLLGTSNASLAQQSVPSTASPMTELADLSQFVAPGANWQLAGAVYSDPDKAKTLAITKEGRGVIANLQTDEVKGNLFTQFEHQDLELELEVMVPKGSNSGIYFQGRYEVQIRDSWQSRPLKPSDMGGIYYRFNKDKPRGQRTYEGTAPPFDAATAPGLWQFLKVVFEAPRFEASSSGSSGKKIRNAIFREVWLNGRRIHQGVEVTGPTRSAAFDDEQPWGPLMIQGDHGPVAYRNIRYRKLQKSGEDVAPVVAADQEPFDDYIQEIPGEARPIEMVAVTGGRYTMGAAAESDRPDAEKPAHGVTVDDFWMGKFEITWEQYDAFVFGDFAASQFKEQSVLEQLGVDAVSGATAPWEDMSFGMGRGTYPAVNMTQYAAVMYARWLTSKTGVFYRLPTEAEWEYACKKGQTDTGNALTDSAVFEENADGGYEKTGSKSADESGIHDLLGNVSEWVMDQYDDQFYAVSGEDNPWHVPTKLYPRVARGGSWMDAADEVSCTTRKPSKSSWKIIDPQIPKSDWWHTSAPFVGFRVVRPKSQPSPEEIKTFWLEAMPDYGLD